MECYIIKQKEQLKSRDLMDRLLNNDFKIFLSNILWDFPPIIIQTSGRLEGYSELKKEVEGKTSD